MTRFFKTTALAALTTVLGVSVVIYGQQSRVTNTASNAALNVTTDSAAPRRHSTTRFPDPG